MSYWIGLVATGVLVGLVSTDKSPTLAVLRLFGCMVITFLSYWAGLTFGVKP